MKWLVLAIALLPSAASAGRLVGGGSSSLLDGSITTAKLADGAVETVKLATDAVTTPKIITGAVNTMKLATDAVTNANILNAAIDSSKLSFEVLPFSGGNPLIRSAAPTLVFSDTDSLDPTITVNGGYLNLTNEAGAAKVSLNTATGFLGVGNVTPATILAVSSGTISIDGTSAAMRIGAAATDSQLADGAIQMLLQGGGNALNNSGALGIVLLGDAGNLVSAGYRIKSGAVDGISAVTPVAQLYNVNSNALEVYTAGATPLVLGTNSSVRMKLAGDGEIAVIGAVTVGDRATISSMTVTGGFVVANASSGTVLYVSTNGFFGAPFQPRAKVTTSSQLITPSATQSVFWNDATAEYDIGNLMVAASSDTFTVPHGASGSYTVRAHIQLPNAAFGATCFIQVNGTNKDTFQVAASATWYTECGGDTDVELNGGDTVRFRINQTNATAITVCAVGNGPDCTFSIRKN